MDTVNMGQPMSETNKCPQCGTPLPAGALAGLCPACLLKAGAAADSATDARHPAFNPPTVAELAAKFPQLEILELIGKGGMGAVYKARQRQLDRVVALKILPPGIGGDPAFAERFAREARALAKLNHPGIVTIYDFGRADGLFFFFMEFVDGVNLRQLLHAGRISAREALAIVPQICDALQFAHDQGIVHRDIKPENILLDRRGRVKVADFGLAKIIGGEAIEPSGAGGAGAGSPALTESGKVMGTPQYMAPEQKEHPDTVDHRADIYALGVVFYQMLTGELPGGKIEPPSSKVHIDVRLDEIVLRALEKEPELRYQQASVLKTQVETIAMTPPGGSPREETPAESGKGNQSHVSPVAAHPGAGKFKRWLKKIFLLQLPAAIIIALIIRTFFLQPFKADTDAAAPEIPKGSRVLAWKLSRNFAPGDVIVYRRDGVFNLGRVAGSDTNVLYVNRNGKPDFTVARADVLGKVVMLYWRGSANPAPATAPSTVRAAQVYTGDIGVYLDSLGSVAPPTGAASQPSPGENEEPSTVYFNIPQDEVQPVVKALDAGHKLPVDVYDAHETRLLGEGILVAVDNQINQQTGTLRCKASVLPNTNALLYSNQFVNVRMLLEMKHGATLIPTATVQSAAEGAFVFVLNTNGVASKRPVTTGVTDGGISQITQGLSPGDIVAADHFDNLHDGMRVSYEVVQRPADRQAPQLVAEASQLWQRQKLVEAGAEFQQAIQLDPDNAAAWNGLGWIHFNSGQSAEAEIAFQRAISIEPDQPAALNGLGQIYLSQGKYDEAEKYLLQAAPQAPAAWFGLARLYLLEGKFDQARKWAEDIVDSGQGDETANKMLEAAKARTLSDGLRWTIEPQAAKTIQNSAQVNAATGVPAGNNAAAPEQISNQGSTNTSGPGWSPPPGEKVDLQSVLNSAQSLAAEGSYEDALQHYLWYFEHSRNDAGHRGVRLSFTLSGWVELGRRYPKARQALLDIRDSDTREFTDGGGYADLFQEVSSINQYLNQPDATLALFDTIEQRDAPLARECYPYVQDLLVQNREYKKCLAYIGDPQTAFDRIRDSRERLKLWEDQQADRREKQNRMLQAMAKTNAAMPGPPPLPELPKVADNNFVQQTRELIEILVGAGHGSDAEKIQDEALTVLDDARLKSAVSEAKEKAGGQNGSSEPESDASVILSEQPPVVVETYPVSGARNVPPGETEIRVRFSKAMADDSWSWSTAWEDSTPESIGSPHYLDDHRTCVIKVRLKPGKSYGWWLNSGKFQNFQDDTGRPAVPYLLIFKTVKN